MEKQQTLSRVEIAVSFGDCDPAGIAFYPNFFAWMDRTFHAWLLPMGGHAAVCAAIDAMGIGVMNAEAQFRRPVRDGATLILTCTLREWGPKVLSLDYEGHVEEVLVMKGSEVRGVFRRSAGAIVASATDQFRTLVESFDKGRAG